MAAGSADDAAADVRRVGVVGMGTMGSGIAEVVARSGRTVIVVEADDAAVAAGLGRLDASLARAVARGRLDAEAADEARARVRCGTDWRSLADVDLVVEALPEVLDVKRDAFRRLDTVVSPTAVLATNTSSLPVLEVALATRRPDRVLGVHFFNPATTMPLVEVVRGVLTDPAVVAVARSFVASLDRTAITVGDRAGFVANRLLLPYLNDAVAVVASGRATADEVDAAMRVGAGLPMGPIALLDLIGLDVAVGILDRLVAVSDDPRCRAEPLLRARVAEGRTGRKAGAGLRDSGDAAAAPDATDVRDAAVDRALTDRLLLPHLDDAVRMLESGYADAWTIDTAMTLGCGYPVGPLAMVDERGLDTVAAGLERLAAEGVGAGPSALLGLLVAAGRTGRGRGGGFVAHG